MMSIIEAMFGIKKKTSKKKLATAGVAGAMIGASVGAAATKVLTDEKTKRKVLKGMDTVKKQVTDKMHDVKAPSQKKKESKSTTKPVVKAKSVPSKAKK
jgi:hypothetical protein